MNTFFFDFFDKISKKGIIIDGVAYGGTEQLINTPPQPSLAPQPPPPQLDAFGNPVVPDSPPPAPPQVDAMGNPIAPPPPPATTPPVTTPLPPQPVATQQVVNMPATFSQPNTSPMPI